MRRKCAAVMAVAMVVAAVVLLGNGWLSVPGDRGNERIMAADSFVIVVPHPDDETLGFAGLIHAALQASKDVSIVLATQGDGNGYGCFFWKNGYGFVKKQAPTMGCTEKEMADYAAERMKEWHEVVTALGVPAHCLADLAYPDGYLRKMYHLESAALVTGKSGRVMSNTGRPYLASSLRADLKDIFAINPGATILTTHPKDGHMDHAALAYYVRDAVKELEAEGVRMGPVYWTVIHEPGCAPYDPRWPPPRVWWWARKGRMAQDRERRYRPSAVLTPPRRMKERPLVFYMDQELWQPNGDSHPLMRQLIDMYESQVGFKCRSPEILTPQNLGGEDWRGFFLSFVKQNHLYWEATEDMGSLQ